MFLICGAKSGILAAILPSTTAFAGLNASAKLLNNASSTALTPLEYCFMIEAPVSLSNSGFETFPCTTLSKLPAFCLQILYRG